MHRQKKDFIRIAAAVDKINKVADFRLSRFEGKQGKFLLRFSSYDCIEKSILCPMTKNELIYHARNVNR